MRGGRRHLKANGLVGHYSIDSFIKPIFRDPQSTCFIWECLLDFRILTKLLQLHWAKLNDYFIGQEFRFPFSWSQLSGQCRSNLTHWTHLSASSVRKLELGLRNIDLRI